MFKFLTRTKALSWLLPVALLAMAKAHAEPMTFSYTFVGTESGMPSQPYAPGSILFGQIDGTIDPSDPNRVIINSFGTVSLSRPGFPLFTFPTIDNNEFNTFPSGNTPVMSFDGSGIDFRTCPRSARQFLLNAPTFPAASFFQRTGIWFRSSLSSIIGGKRLSSN